MSQADVGYQAFLHLACFKQGGVESNGAKIIVRTPPSATIESFWQNANNQNVNTWKDHLGINEVMLATSLDPSSVLWLGNDADDG